MKKKASSGSTAIAAEISDSSGLPTFEERLAGLPEKYRQHIIRQYELSDRKYSIVDVIRWASPLEIALMSLGTLTAIGAGLNLFYSGFNR